MVWCFFGLGFWGLGFRVQGLGFRLAFFLNFRLCAFFAFSFLPVSCFLLFVFSLRCSLFDFALLFAFRVHFAFRFLLWLFLSDRCFPLFAFAVSFLLLFLFACLLILLVAFCFLFPVWVFVFRFCLSAFCFCLALPSDIDSLLCFSASLLLRFSACGLLCCDVPPYTQSLLSLIRIL